MAKKEPNLMDLPVSYGNASFDKKTARVGVTVDREHLKIGVADKNMCDMRLTGTLVAKPEGDQEGQGRLNGMEDDFDLTGIFDVKGFGVHSNTITFGLTFAIKGLNRDKLSNFAGRSGRLMIAQVDEIPEEEKETPEDDGGDDDA